MSRCTIKIFMIHLRVFYKYLNVQDMVIVQYFNFDIVKYMVA